MPTSFTLTDPLGSVLGHPAPIGEFAYSLVMLDVGVLQCSIGQEWAKHLNYEHRIEVYRRIPPLASRLIRSYFVEGIEEATDEKQRDVLRLTAYCPNALLAWRDIEAKAGSAEATKSDHADDIMKAYVREQMLGSIDPLDAGHFAVAADQHLGTTLTVRNAWQTMLGALRQVSDESAGVGSRVYFEIADQAPGALLEFRTGVGCLGTDHSRGSSAPLNIGLSFGNVSGFSRLRDASEEVNHVIAAGTGQNDARIVGEYADPAATRSIWSRKKLVYSENTVSLVATLNDVAKRRVSQGRARDRIVATLVDAPGFRWGYDWGWGDKLTVTHKLSAYTGIVNAVKWEVSEEGHETLDAKIEVVI